MINERYKESNIIQILVRDVAKQLYGSNKLEASKRNNGIVLIKPLTTIKETINRQHGLKLTNRNVSNVFRLAGGKYRTFRVDGEVRGGWLLPYSFVGIELEGK